MSAGDERIEDAPEATEPDEDERPPEPDVEAPDEPDEDEGYEEDDEGRPRRESRRRRLERLVPEVLKRAIERGIEAGLGTLGGSKHKEREGTIPPPAPGKEPAVKDGRELGSVPKEIAGYVFSQIDDTKSAMVRVVAREVREFLEAADLSKELQKALTSLSFEVRTEIRFIPNDAGGIKPEVKAKVAPAVKRDRPPGRRPTAFDEEKDGDED